jgi:hypothetical protein
VDLGTPGKVIQGIRQTEADCLAALQGEEAGVRVMRNWRSRALAWKRQSGCWAKVEDMCGCNLAHQCAELYAEESPHARLDNRRRSSGKGRGAGEAYLWM